MNRHPSGGRVRASGAAGPAPEVSVLTCSSCDGAITARGDNRYRWCAICGWYMHHHCWIDLLSEDALPCPRGPVKSYEVQGLVHVEPPAFTPTGRRKSTRVTYLHQYRDLLPGHGDGIGMLGQWSMECDNSPGPSDAEPEEGWEEWMKDCGP